MNLYESINNNFDDYVSPEETKQFIIKDVEKLASLPNEQAIEDCLFDFLGACDMNEYQWYLKAYLNCAEELGYDQLADIILNKLKEI